MNLSADIQSYFNISPHCICVFINNSKTKNKFVFETQFLNKKFIEKFGISHIDKAPKILNDFFSNEIAKEIIQNSESVFNSGIAAELSNKVIQHSTGNFFVDIEIQKLNEWLVLKFKNCTTQPKEEQKDKDQLLQEAFQLFKMATFEVDMQTKIITSSFNLEKLVGVKQSNKPLTLDFLQQLMLPAEQQESKTNLEKLFQAKENIVVERKFIQPDGNTICLKVFCKSIFKNNICIKLIGTVKDITDSKTKLDESLKNSKLIEYAHTNLGMGTYTIDLKTGLLETDFNISALLEMPNLQFKFTPSELAVYSDKEDFEDSMNRFQQILIDKKPYNYVRKFKSASGKIIYLEVNVMVVEEDGKVEKLFGVFRNITTRKIQEIKLQQADEKLRMNSEMLAKAHHLLEMGSYEMNIKTGIIVSDLDPIELFELPKNQRIFTIDEYIKMLATEDKIQFEKDLNNATKTHTKYSSERKLITPKGNIRYIEILAMPVFDEQNNLIKIEGTLRNITERKSKEVIIQQTKLELSETIKMLEEAQRLLQMGTYTVDLKTKNITSTLDINELYELPEDNTEFTLADYFKYINKQEVDEAKVIFKKLIDQGTPFSRERKILTAKGNDKYVEITGNPFYENNIITKITGTFRDITFRKRLEQKLLNTEIKLLEAQNLLRMGTYEMDLKNNKIEHSLELSEILEIEDSKMIQSIEEFISYVHNDDKLLTSTHIKALIEGANVENKVERKMITRKGNIKFLELFARTIVANGVATKLYGTFRDITEKKLQEIWMQENQTRLSEASLALKNGTFHFNLNSKMITLSDEVITILENKIPKFIHVLDFFKFIPNQTRNYFFQNFVNLIEQEEPIKQIVKLQFEDNSYHYIDVSGNITTDKKFYKGTFRDITEQHEKDIALMRSEERFRLLFENTPSLYFLLNTDGIIMSVNQYGVDYLGFKKTDLINHHHTILFHPDDKALASKNLELLKQTTDNFLQWEIRKKKKSGEIIWVKETARISRNQNDEPIYLLVCEDITSEVQNRTLVNKKQEELIKAKERAEVAMIEKQQFTSIMSHEIRTPLNAVIGMTNLLLMENPREDQVVELNTLKFAAENLLVLVNDILDFSKIEAGKVLLEKIPVDLFRLVQNLKGSYQFKADEKGIFINTIIDSEIPKNLLGDPMRLSQILNNLLSNAIKFTDKGFVEISLLKIVHPIENEIKVRFEVSDTGIGIAAEKQKSIFQMFSQANSDTTRKYGGTGLGLTITQKLIQLYRSEIFLHSELGKGTTFSFDLIFQISTVQEIDSHIHIKPLATNATLKKILLVEDNEINRRVTTKFLLKWNLDVDTANNGLEAIAKVEAEQYDLILMDIHMPEMNGIDACNIIRNHADEKIKNIPIIALTAATMDNEKVTLIEVHGMNDYISKPFNPSDLFNKIYQHIKN
ncbi:MAG: hypothetical protein RL708_579 [Bacteroidota bacterium]|jgi:PAS domain S-box-containing protein